MATKFSRDTVLNNKSYELKNKDLRHAFKYYITVIRTKCKTVSSHLIILNFTFPTSLSRLSPVIACMLYAEGHWVHVYAYPSLLEPTEVIQ